MGFKTWSILRTTRRQALMALLRCKRECRSLAGSMVEEEEETNGIKNNTFNSISIYPNPFINDITINTELNGQLTVFDLSGKMVYQSSSEAKTIPLSHLKSGIYMLVLTLDSISYTEKIIKK